jgi:hypothetical protein
MNKQIYLIMFLVAFGAYQAGFLTKCWWDYKYGAVPMITPSDLVQIYEEK